VNNRVIHVDLQAVAAGKGIIANDNLAIAWYDDVKGMSALKVSPIKKEFNFEDKWVLLFDSIEFDEAIIEFDALGQSEPQQSNFLGIAFHATDDQTHDAVYYRPLIFVRKIQSERFMLFSMFLIRNILGLSYAVTGQINLKRRLCQRPMATHGFMPK